MSGRFGVNALDELATLIGLGEPELLDRWDDAPVTRAGPRAYEGLDGLTLVQSPSRPGVYLYLKDEQVLLVHLERSDLEAAPLLAALGPAEGELRSREGKQYRLHVWPEAGIAVSMRHRTEVGFVELFRPMTLAQYEADIYVDVGPFIR